MAFCAAGARRQRLPAGQLKPKNQRAPSDDVVARLRPKLGQVTGAALFLNPVQDVRVGGRQSNATYQYTLEADDLPTLQHLGDKARLPRWSCSRR